MKLQTLKPHVQMLKATTSTAPTVEINPSSWRTDKATSSQRGYGYKWQQARAAYLLKHPLCVMCLSAANVHEQALESVILACTAKGIAIPWANTVDHKVAHRGDMKVFWDSTQWQSLCGPCHSSHAQRRDNATRGW